MKYFQLFVSGALVVCVIMNVILFSKLGNIENELVQARNFQHQILSTVNGQTSHIQSVMDDIHREQSWISAIRMDVETTDVDSGQGNVIFEWQIRELPNDAEVVFNYSFDLNDQYTSVAAEEIQSGLFQVKIPFEVTAEPRWEIFTHSQGGRNSEYTDVEDVMEEYEESELKFYVSMFSEGMVKSATEEITDLGYVGSMYYGSIMTDLSSHDDRYFINVSSDNYDSAYHPVEVYVLSYEDVALTEERQLNSDTFDDDDGYRGGMAHFHLEKPLEKGSFTKLILKVVYNNGKVFEREIW